ncbi:hypothetical protein FDP41_005404 [Naegleria fowleri]|uniref:Cytochrome oxidase assembly protein n=1 Tax=Naegleria fowleri TaxID=5763 RepID=A0A6A5BN58_NAEFO|nr:uncharacterized protein FDP41_005404 [Naegleria fowleri]KAF0975410.1 hypothetical protein FDP41_005404 [Naegleria fowleri]CAG4719042.1 unnamed protein product [Naegleria fowleri]
MLKRGLLKSSSHSTGLLLLSSSKSNYCSSVVTNIDASPKFFSTRKSGVQYKMASSSSSSGSNALLLVMNMKNQQVVGMRNFSTTTAAASWINQQHNSSSLRSNGAFPKINSNNRFISVYPQNMEYSTSTQNVQQEVEADIPGRKAVLVWLSTIGFLVFAIVIVGGLTRLEEGGLSMVDWSPLGSLPPMTPEEWEAEFERYKQFPEYKKKNEGMTVEEFKYIFYYEYYHRMLGRLIGAVYALPAVFFAAKGYFSGKNRVLSPATVLGIGAAIGFQGLLGWYMVKSGLDENHELMKKYNSIPRVSQYRLASHLCAAFGIYAMTMWQVFNLATRNKPIDTFMGSKLFKVAAPIFFSLVFITAASGAFVAGMDAGLVYNEFPLMGGSLVPSDIMVIEPWYKNLFENATTVQFQHRWLATFVGTAIAVFYYTMTRGGRGKQLPKPVKRSLNYLLAVVGLQYTLGITTLLTYVPTSIASAHQTGSLTLFTFALWMAHVAKRIR